MLCMCIVFYAMYVYRFFNAMYVYRFLMLCMCIG